MAVALSSRGFGYAVTEGADQLIDYGNMGIEGDKNAGSLAGIAKMIVRNQPEILVLQDVDAKGSRRAQRIKELHRKVVALAKKHKLKVVTIPGKKLRSALLGNENGTKWEIAELLAQRFPDELASRLPRKRKPWESEDARMDIFDAVTLAATYRLNDYGERRR